jgi:hypothetical protein
VGKTAQITAAFERANMRWKYFSASTMDAWVDFVGAPKDKIGEDGEEYLDLVRPKWVNDGDVEALFFDEFNRSKDKVRNAVMELIQFKSINGRKFENLKMIWAAVNPFDTEEDDLSYDVERLDPAQLDRFTIQINVPYEPSLAYFRDKYGVAGEGAVEWWNDLTDEDAEYVSPRRLEDAIRVNLDGGNLRHVLNSDKLNVTKLLQRIDTGSVEEKLASLFDSKDDTACKRTFSSINFENDALEMIMASEEYINFFFPYMSHENISKELTNEKCANASHIISNCRVDKIAEVVSDIINAATIPRSEIMLLTKAAKTHGLDTVDAMQFKKTIEETLETPPTTKGERFQTLQALSSNFNTKSSTEDYESCMAIMVDIIYHTSDDFLNDTNHPTHQFSNNIFKNIQKVLQNRDMSVISVWNDKVKVEGSFGDETRVNRIENYIKSFISK